MLLSSHPGPSLAVTAICVGLGLTIGLEPWRLAVLAIVVLVGQFSVGLSNDALDAARDRAVGRTDKPVARGEISSRAVLNAAIACGVLAVLGTVTLGWQATLAHSIFITCGWSYNLWLKRTAASVLPYLVGFGVLPSVVTLSLTPAALPAPWTFATGALLGLAAHFANALPDLADDRATGIVGLPHRLGERVSGITIFVALVTASAAATLGIGVADLALVVALALQLGIAVLGTALVTRQRPGQKPGRLMFRLVILGALLVVAALLVSGARIVA